MVQIITRDEIKSALDRGEAVILVEALPINYYNDAHLPHAVQMNYDEIDAKATSIFPDKSAKIIIYCSNAACNNSTKAASCLTSLGYNNVFKYPEGKQDWINAGLPVQKSI